MRFDALGPALPRPGIVDRVREIALSPNVVTAFFALLTVSVSFCIGVWMDTASAAELDAANRGLDLATARHAVLVTTRQTLSDLEDVGKEYGPVRDSGYSVAKALVSIGNAWPDPRTGYVSIKCQTPNEDGSAVTLTARARDYPSWASTVDALHRKGYFPIPSSDSKKDNGYDFQIQVRR